MNFNSSELTTIVSLILEILQSGQKLKTFYHINYAVLIVKNTHIAILIYISLGLKKY